MGRFRRRRCILSGIIRALEEVLRGVRVKPEAKWMIAEGAGAGRMARSIPMETVLDDALLANLPNWNATSSGARNASRPGVITGARTMRQLQVELQSILQRQRFLRAQEPAK